MSESTVIYYERVVGELLGISRPELTWLRKEHLKKNKGWRMEGRDVVLTQAGLDDILVRVRASHNAAGGAEINFSPARVPVPAPAPPPPQKKGRGIRGHLLLCDRARPPAELVTMTVTRCYPNFRLLQARMPDGQEVDVRVKNNKNFVPRMTLKARLNADGKYEMEGRCPRTRGRY